MTESRVDDVRDRLRAVRVEGIDKVTGQIKYAADIAQPGLLWGKVLRSTQAHARIVSIDTSRAKALPGVQAVLTGADLPDVRVGRMMRDQPVLARDRVRFVGEKVAAVAADDASIAEEAIALIEVEYEPLPAVYDPLEAMEPDAPQIHDDTAALLPPTAQPAKVRNGVSHTVWGASEEEIERALAGADHVFEHTFQLPLQHQGYIEPHACVVATHPDGKVDIWASQKAPFMLREYLRLGMGLKLEDIRVHILPVGGDFGGKGALMDVSVAYFLSLATGRPVKMVMSYNEELIAGDPRHFGSITIRCGVNSDGTIVARHVRQVYASGGYASMKPMPDVNLPAAKHAGGAYRLQCGRVESIMVYTNTVHSGHMRSPGGMQALYAVEVQLDEIARQLGIDPLEIRRRNAPEAGDPHPTDGVFHESQALEVLATAARAIDWDAPARPFVGKGLALSEHNPRSWPFGADIEVDRDGQVLIRTSIPEVGVGAHTIFAQMVARELTIPAHRVRVVGDISNLPHDRGVGASVTTRMVGGAHRIAARRLRDRLAAAVAAEFGADPADVRVADGLFHLPNGTSVSLGEAVVLSGGTAVERYTHQAADEKPITGWTAQAAEVEVDPETGRLTIRRLITVHEVGEIVNPLLHQGQIDGSTVQGVGAVTMELLVLDDGRILNPNLGEYRLPTIADIPPLETVLLPPNPEGGIMPIGEAANSGFVAAIANAVGQVIGRCPTAYPILAEDILAALRGKTADDALVGANPR